MNLNITNSTLLVSALATALMAGLFYAWTYSVTIGLALLSDREYITAMQSMNRAIQNPMFFAAFFGAAILLPLSTYMNFKPPLDYRFYLLLVATLVYWVGVMGVTVLGNVPMNEILDKFDINQASVSDIKNQRLSFENRWNMLNSFRTISSCISLILVLLACIFNGEK